LLNNCQFVCYYTLLYRTSASLNVAPGVKKFLPQLSTIKNIKMPVTVMKSATGILILKTVIKTVIKIWHHSVTAAVSLPPEITDLDNNANAFKFTVVFTLLHNMFK
jgi:hypothetical protein